MEINDTTGMKYDKDNNPIFEITEEGLRGLSILRGENNFDLPEELIKEIVKNHNFKNAIKVLFGTTDMNHLHSMSESVIEISKYVNSIKDAEELYREKQKVKDSMEQ